MQIRVQLKEDLTKYHSDLVIGTKGLEIIDKEYLKDKNEREAKEKVELKNATNIK